MVAVIQVLVIAILIAVGFFLAKKGIFTPKTGQQLSYLLINFVTPVLIFNSFQIDYTPEKLHGLVTAVLLALLSFAVIIAFSFVYCGRGEQNKVERLAVTFSNAGFMGIPLISGIYGTEGVFYASIMVIVFNLLFFTYGISAIRGSFSLKSLREILLSPTILAVAAGLLFFLFQIRLPEPFHSAAVHLANLNTPLAMIVAGISISQSNLAAVFKNLRLYKVLAGKLLLAPLLVALTYMLVPGAALIKEILVIQIGCPTAALVGITLLQCGKDNRVATEYFTLTTLTSMLTIPLVKLLCGFLF